MTLNSGDGNIWPTAQRQQTVCMQTIWDPSSTADFYVLFVCKGNRRMWVQIPSSSPDPSFSFHRRQIIKPRSCVAHIPNRSTQLTWFRPPCKVSLPTESSIPNYIQTQYQATSFGFVPNGHGSHPFCLAETIPQLLLFDDLVTTGRILVSFTSRVNAINQHVIRKSFQNFSVNFTSTSENTHTHTHTPLLLLQSPGVHSRC